MRSPGSNVVHVGLRNNNKKAEVGRVKCSRTLMESTGTSFPPPLYYSIYGIITLQYHEYITIRIHLHLDKMLATKS